MKNLAPMLVVVLLLAATALHAAAVPVSESSYVNIFNFTGLYNIYGYETEWKGFLAGQADLYHSVPTIEAKVVNFQNPGSPPGDQNHCDQNGLMFDFHDGNASIGDYAEASPVVMIGDEPWYHAEFDWTANINSEAGPYLRLTLEGSSSPAVQPQILWQVLPGAGSHSGHVVLDFADRNITNAVYFHLAVEPVPEPPGAPVILAGLGVLAARARRRKL